MSKFLLALLFVFAVVANAKFVFEDLPSVKELLKSVRSYGTEDVSIEELAKTLKGDEKNVMTKQRYAKLYVFHYTKPPIFLVKFKKC
jgi:hypothetical protein